MTCQRNTIQMVMNDMTNTKNSKPVWPVIANLNMFTGKEIWLFSGKKDKSRSEIEEGGRGHWQPKEFHKIPVS